MQIPRHYTNAYRTNLLNTIRELDTTVFTRDDLTHDHSNKEQLKLNRALKMFIQEGMIVKISHGLYAKAMKLTLPNGNAKVVLQDPFEEVAIEALNKLGVQWELGSAIQAYNRGETTQVPAVFIVKLNSRFRGTIHAEGRSVIFEREINAR